MIGGRLQKAHGKEGTLGLSFIDVVSGGFGAAFFLFLVFASLPVDEPPRAGGGNRFVEVWLEWKDEAALGEILLTHNNGRLLRLTANDYKIDPETGKMEARNPIRDAEFWTTAHTSGFAWFDRNRMSLANQSESRAVRFRFTDPCPGDLRFWVNSHSVSDPTRWLEAASPVASLPEFRFQLRVLISDGQPKPTIVVHDGSVDASVAPDFTEQNALPLKSSGGIESDQPKAFVSIRSPKRQSEIPSYCI